MAPHLAFFLLVLACAALFALFEIQIEGPHGWAANLPTWKIDNAVTRVLMDGKPLTGYHFYALVFVFVFSHIPYAFGGVAPSLALELGIFSFNIFFWTAEDFLWFVLNPAYGIRRFRPEHIEWHRRQWWWIMPRGYWLGLVLAFALYLAAGYVR